MSVEMKLGRWQARDGTTIDIVGQFPQSYMPWASSNGVRYYPDGRYLEYQGDTPQDLVRYLGPLSPTLACADKAGTPVVSTVSTETAGEQLQRMRERYNAMEREASIYSGLLDSLDQAKSDLEEAIKILEKEVEG